MGRCQRGVTGGGAPKYQRFVYVYTPKIPVPLGDPPSYRVPLSVLPCDATSVGVTPGAAIGRPGDGGGQTLAEDERHTCNLGLDVVLPHKGLGSLLSPSVADIDITVDRGDIKSTRHLHGRCGQVVLDPVERDV